MSLLFPTGKKCSHQPTQTKHALIFSGPSQQANKKMRNPSIVPEIINSESIQILDENNIPIAICKHSPFLFNYALFRQPFIIIDNIEKRRYKNIEIKRVDLDYLKGISLRLVSLRATPKMRSRPRQAKCYMLESMDNPIPTAEVLHKLPKEHFIELDVINKRIRIKGNNAYPYRRNENASEWLQIIEVDNAQE